MVEGTISNIKVLDLTHYVAGPYCTKLLAGLGAEVIKIEKPGCGDGARKISPFPKEEHHPEKSEFFLYLNDNKKSITLDLKASQGLRIFQELVKDANIVVENFRPRVKSNLGIGYETLKKINPSIVMTSISNFGQTGPYRDYKAYEIVLQALSGLLYINGDYDREPVKFYGSQAQYMAGIIAAGATLTALYSSNEAGQHVDVSIIEAAMLQLTWYLASYSYLGAIFRRKPKGPLGEFIWLFPLKNGYVIPLVLGYLDVELLSRILDVPELADPKFQDFAGRTKHMDELQPLLENAFKKQTKNFFHTAQELGFPFGVVQSMEDLANCPQLRAREYFTQVNHPLAGTLAYPGAPFKMSETPWQIARHTPLLGEHNEEVYRNLGYSSSDLQSLKDSGVI